MKGGSHGDEFEKAQELGRLLSSRAQDNRMNCQTAFEIASELGVSVREIGRTLDELGIKIVGCQLGCF